MKWLSLGGFVAFVMLISLGVAQPAPAWAVVAGFPDASGPPSRPRPVLSADGTSVKMQRGGAQPGPVGHTDRLIVKYRDKTLARAATLSSSHVQALSSRGGVALTHLRAMSGNNQLFKLPKRMTHDEAKAIADKLSADPTVEYAVPDRLMFPMQLPNDPSYANQWHYKSPTTDHEPAGINLPPAWDITTGSNNLVVGVIDTGIVNHADLQGRILPGYNFISDAARARNGIGRSADASDLGDWVNFSESATPTSGFYGCAPTNSSWHGTHVTGTIAATSNNGTGVTGINWGSKILPVRALGKCGGHLSDIIDGMRWAAGLPVAGVPANANPARVINMSLGSYGSCDAAMQGAINDVVAAGTVVVVAAGNDYNDVANYTPAGCSGIISVAAVNRNGGAEYNSNHGQAVSIAAPGGELSSKSTNGVLSTLNSGLTSPVASPAGDTYGYREGTSMAASHVTGVVSLMLSLQPTLTPTQVAQILQATARPFPTATGSTGGDCTTSLCGAGIVDAYQALHATSVNMPLISTTPLSLIFTTHPGDPNPPSQSIAITNPGGGTVNWSVSSSAPWLHVSPTGGQGNGTVTVSVDTSGLTPATADTGTITISAAGIANSPVTIPVSVKFLLKLHAPIPIGVADHIQTAVGGKVYVIGGQPADPGENDENVGTLVQIYDTASDTWTMGTPKPTPISETNAAVIDGKIYIPAGYDNEAMTFLSALAIYDPATDRWSSGAPLPTPMVAPTVEAVNGKLYVMGGEYSWLESGVMLQTEVFNTTYVYDPTANTWSRVADMPGPEGWSYANSAVINGRIYVFGGSVTPYSAIVYDPAADRWSAAGSLSTRRYEPGAAALAGKLYDFGGTTPQPPWPQDAYVYDSWADSWSGTSLILNLQRYSLKATTVGTSIYVMGGFYHFGGYDPYSTKEGGPSDINESYDSSLLPVTDTVTFNAGPNGVLTGTTNQTVAYGGSATQVTAVAAAGFHFVNWTGTGGFVTTTANPLTVANITANMAITANFAANPVNGVCGTSNNATFTVAPTTNLCATGTASSVTGAGPWSWSCNGANGGTTANCSAAIQTFAVTFSAGPNGTLSGAASQTVNYGGSATPVTAVAATGYHFVNWTGTGGFVTTTANPLTVTNVTTNMTITANFAANPVNGVCGTSNGQSFAIAPTANLCATGSAGSVTGAGPWSWTCSGSNGGTTANCSADKAATAPVTTATPGSGAYAGGSLLVTLNATNNATIYYTTNSTTPTTSSAVYTAPIPVSGTATLKYFARDTSGAAEPVKSATYTVAASGPPAASYAAAKTGTSFTILRSEGGSAFTPVVTGTTNTSFIDTAPLKPNTVYQYAVTSNVDPTQTAFVTIRTPLYNGWNIVAVPYATTGIPATSFFASPVSAIYQWLPTGATPESSSTQLGSYTTVSTLTPGLGYFVKAANNGTLLTYSGAPGPTSATVTLKPGWTMIANPTTTNKTNIGTTWMVDNSIPLATAIGSGKIGSSLYWWNGATYDFWTIASNPQVEPWKAYWIVNLDSVSHTLTIQ